MPRKKGPVTIQEAKTRFKNHTRIMLSKWAKEEIKKENIWTIEEDVPTLTAGKLTLEFRRTRGYVYCLRV